MQLPRERLASNAPVALGVINGVVLAVSLGVIYFGACDDTIVLSTIESSCTSDINQFIAGSCQSTVLRTSQGNFVQIAWKLEPLINCDDGTWDLDLATKYVKWSLHWAWSLEHSKEEH